MRGVMWRERPRGRAGPCRHQESKGTPGWALVDKMKSMINSDHLSLTKAYRTASSCYTELIRANNDLGEEWKRLKNYI